MHGEEGDASTLDRPAILIPTNTPFAEALAYYSQGLIFDHHGQADYAVTNYLKATQTAPDWDELYLLTSKSLIALDRGEEAKALIAELAAKRSNQAGPHLWKAVIHQAYGEDEQAMQSYRKAIRLQPSEIAPYLEASSILFRRKQYAQAIKLLRQAIDKATPTHQAYRYLADIYKQWSDGAESNAEQQRYRKKAIATLKTALAQDAPDPLPLVWHLARLSIEAGDLDEGIAHYTRIEKSKSDDLELKEKIANEIEQAMGHSATAIAGLRSHLDRNPQNPFAWFYLGNLLEKAGRTDRARSAYVQSTVYPPAQSSAFWKASLLSIDDNPEETQRLLERGLQALPDNARIMEMLAFVYLQQKQYDKSVEQFERVDSILTDQGIAIFAEKFHFNFALAAQGNKECDLAALHLTSALRLNLKLLPGFAIHVSKLEHPEAIPNGLRTLRSVSLAKNEPEIHFYIGLLSKYNSQYDAAISSFSYTLNMSAGHPREDEILSPFFYYSYATACDKVGRTAEAEQYFKAVIEKDPQHTASLNHLAYMYAERGTRLPEALTYIQQALAIESDSGAFLDTRGWVYFQMGDAQKALTDLKRARTMIPDDPTILDHLGDAHLKNGNTLEAIECWRAAIAIAPDMTQTKQKLHVHQPASPAQPRGVDREK